jgi:hypothetical protein
MSGRHGKSLSFAGLRANRVDKYELVRRLATDVDGLPAAARRSRSSCTKGSVSRSSNAIPPRPGARGFTSEAGKTVQVTQRRQ